MGADSSETSAKGIKEIVDGERDVHAILGRRVLAKLETFSESLHMASLMPAYWLKWSLIIYCISSTKTFRSIQDQLETPTIVSCITLTL
jgi:hypothetical protein